MRPRGCGTGVQEPCGSSPGTVCLGLDARSGSSSPASMRQPHCNPAHSRPQPSGRPPLPSDSGPESSGPTPHDSRHPELTLRCPATTAHQVNATSTRGNSLLSPLLRFPFPPPPWGFPTERGARLTHAATLAPNPCADSMVASDLVQTPSHKPRLQQASHSFFYSFIQSGIFVKTTAAETCAGWM